MPEIVMSYGKFRGCKISEIPSGYLKWMAENMENGTLCYAADDEYQRREKWDEHFWGDKEN